MKHLKYFYWKNLPLHWDHKISIEWLLTLIITINLILKIENWNVKQNFFFSIFQKLKTNKQGGITYYAPQTQPPPRPILPQRRHTNAIPIMAPPERSNKNVHSSRSTTGSSTNSFINNDSIYNNNINNDQQQGSMIAQSSDTVENIDHILDNMFVQRPHPYQSATGLTGN